METEPKAPEEPGGAPEAAEKAPAEAQSETPPPVAELPTAEPPLDPTEDVPPIVETPLEPTEDAPPVVETAPDAPIQPNKAAEVVEVAKPALATAALPEKQVLAEKSAETVR